MVPTMEKKNIPQVRFPEFEGEWKKKSIGNILKIGSGKDYKHLNNGNIPVYGTGGQMTSVDDFLYEGESVGIGRKGTIDNPVFLSGKFWTVDTLFYTHSFNGILPYFVYLLFQKINWKEYNEASGVPSLSKSTIEKIKLSIPSLPEQQRIASFLTAVDEKLTALKKKKALLEQYKKGVMQGIFSQNQKSQNHDSPDSPDYYDEKDLKSGKSSPSQKSRFRQLRFKDENGNDFPNWEKKKLGEVAYKTSSDIAAVNIEENEGEYIIYGAAGVLKKVDFFREEEEYISIVKDGAGVGRVFLCSAKTSVLGTLDIIKPIGGNLYYLFYYLQQMNFGKYVTGTTIPHIYFSDYKSEKILYPCLAEQTKIANFLSAIDQKINHCQQQIEQTTQWKKGLLQKMFC